MDCPGILDAIHCHVRSEGQIVKKAGCIAIGINLDGRKDVLGMWVGENESARFWATVLNGLRNRGVEDIFIACTDNLTGFFLLPLRQSSPKWKSRTVSFTRFAIPPGTFPARI